MTDPINLAEHRRRARRVNFNRAELSHLLSLYSARVAAGTWRDYAIDHGPTAAVFSVFRHSHEQPLFHIRKTQSRPGRPVEYSVEEGPRRICVGTDLAHVLTVFDRRLRLAACGAD